MLQEQHDVFYYITVMNENYAQPTLPDSVHDAVLRGCYLLQTHTPDTPDGAGRAVTLLGSGAILGEVQRAAEQLAASGITAYVYSVTSWSELAREGREQAQQDQPGFLARQLADSQGPVIAASDYVCLVPESVRAFVPSGRRYVTLGTDGFGRSDTRAELRKFFGVDAQAISAAAKRALAG